MNRPFTFALAFAFTLFFCGFAEVTVVTQDNFDTLVDGSRPAFIEFYAPWCGHCQNLAPEYERIGEAFKPFQDKVLVGKVDCDEHKELCKKHGVNGYPTLIWFNKEETTKYEDERNADSILAFINQKSGLSAKLKPIRQTLSYVLELNSHVFDSVVFNSGKHVFVEFYAPWCGHCKNLAPKWDKLSTFFANDNVIIAKIDATKPEHEYLAKKYFADGFPTLIFFKLNEPEPITYELPERELDDLVSFINTHGGTNRLEDGTFSGEVGLVAELEPIALDFFKKAADVDTLLTRAQEALKTVKPEDDAQAQLYVKYLERIKAKPEFLETEIARMKKLLASDVVLPAKRDEFSKKLNVLTSFTYDPSVIEEDDEDDEEDSADAEGEEGEGEGEGDEEDDDGLTDEDLEGLEGLEGLEDIEGLETTEGLEVGKVQVNHEEL